jgi:hypothetical protein
MGDRPNWFKILFSGGVGISSMEPYFGILRELDTIKRNGMQWAIVSFYLAKYVNVSLSFLAS